MARDFPVTDFITASIGALGFPFGPGSFAAILRTDTDAAGDPGFFTVDVTAVAWGIYVRSSDEHFQLWDGAGDGGTTIPLNATNGWCLIAVTKATGTVVARYHKYVFSTNTWTHTNGTTAQQNSATPATDIQFAGGPDGQIAVMGVWNVVLTDAQIESLAFSLPPWFAPAQPKGLWIFDQATVAQKLVDISGGGANESAISGTAVATQSVPVFTYGDSLDVFKQPAAAGPIVVATALETDTALALGEKKMKAITTAAETDAAIALGARKKTKLITVATETDTAIALTKKKRKSIVTATETDTAQGVSSATFVAVTTALETDTAIAIGKKKKKAITTATETDTAQLIVVLVPTPLEQVLYSVHIGWSGRNSGVFVVGSSLIAPAIDSVGYDRIKENFSPSYSGTYDDVTQHAKKVSTKHGREGSSVNISAGTIDLTLFDKEQLYNPRNTASPLFDYILPMLPGRVRMSMDTGATWIDLAHGWLRSADFDYDLGTKEAHLHFEDMYLWLDREKEPGPVIVDTGPIRVDEALHLVFNAIIWPESHRVFDRGSNLGNFAADGSKSALQLVEDLMAVDGGIVYQDREMNAVYANVWHRAFETIAHSFEVADLVIPGMDLDNIKNVASSTLEGSEPQVYEDTDSINRYGRAAHSAVTSPWFLDDTAALDTSRRKVIQTKDAKSKVWQFTVSQGPLGYHEQMGILDLLSKIEVVQPDAPGVYHIEQVAHEIEAGKFHIVKWALSEAQEQDPFFIGSGRIAPAVDSVGYEKIV